MRIKRPYVMYVMLCVSHVRFPIPSLTLTASVNHIWSREVGHTACVL